MPTVVTPQGKHRDIPPIFAQYSKEQLVDITGYSFAYIKCLYEQPRRIRPLFRRTVSRILRKPEWELFGQFGLRDRGQDA